MFLHLCVILFTGGVGFPACITGQMTSGGLPPGEGRPLGDVYPGRVCIQGALVLGRPPPPRYMGYYGIWLTSWQYASYLNAFLFYTGFTSRFSINSAMTQAILFSLITRCIPVGAPLWMQTPMDADPLAM